MRLSGTQKVITLEGYFNSTKEGFDLRFLQDICYNGTTVYEYPRPPPLTGTSYFLKKSCCFKAASSERNPLAMSFFISENGIFYL